MGNDLQILGIKLSESSSILILVAANPSLDSMAASLGLYLSLKNAGKNVQIACETDPIVRDSHLVALNEVQSRLPGNNLVLTVDVEGDIVDKVTSSVENGKLSLTIIPKNSTTPIRKENIVFSSSGVVSDLVFVVGASGLSDLGRLSSDLDQLLTKATLVNLSQANSSFGAVNLTDQNSSLSELVTAVVQELKLALTTDAAGNLMQGIESATNNLQSENMTADTFEALAVLYRAGARHKPMTNLPTATIVDNTPIILERQQEDQKDIKALEEELHSMSQTQDISARVDSATVGSHSRPDPTWLKPKIYKSK